MGVLWMNSGVVGPNIAAVNTAILTDHCLQATLTFAGVPSLSPSSVEAEVVFYATF